INNINIKLITIYLIVAFILPGCKSPADQNQTDVLNASSGMEVRLTQEQWKEANISTAQLVLNDIKKTLRLSGTVVSDPDQKITISSPLQGMITKIFIKPGQQVTQGQILFIIEDKEYILLQESYISAKTAYRFAKKDFERQTELNANNAASDKVLEIAEEKMLQLQIETKSREEKLRLLGMNPDALKTDQIKSSMPVSAMISGTVSDVFINVGKYVSPGTELAEMISHAKPGIVLKAFEKDIYLLKPGMQIKAFSNENPDVIWDGKIVNILP